MTHRNWTPVGAAAVLLVLSAGLGGCVSGPPLGHGAGASDQTRQQPGPNQPTKTIDPRDQSANTAPPRTVPIQGQSPNPFGAAPQGALPDPYAHPPR